jgi:hypothetical protein
MNQKIEEFIKQATIEIPHEREWDTTTTYFDKLKFAELIVRECADAADMAWAARCQYCGDYVVEQLGYEISIRFE